MDRGYVKLWRKSIDSSVFKSEHLWILWTWCLMKASHRQMFVQSKHGKGALVINVQPGQFIFGRNKAADAFNWSASTVWKRMQKLAEMGCINIESNNQYSVITICNWEIYQSNEDSLVTSKEQVSDKQVTSKEQVSDTYKHIKHIEKNTINDDARQAAFDSFWSLYPRRVCKAAALKSWAKINLESVPQILEAVRRQKMLDSWQRNNGKYIPHPSTWLNGRRWEDELETVEEWQ